MKGLSKRQCQLSIIFLFKFTLICESYSLQSFTLINNPLMMYHGSEWATYSNDQTNEIWLLSPVSCPEHSSCAYPTVGQSYSTVSNTFQDETGIVEEFHCFGSHCAVSVGDTLYMTTPNKQFCSYNIHTQQWINPVSTMPIPLKNSCLTSDGRYIYFIGGYDNNYRNYFQIYDLQLNVWLNEQGIQTDSLTTSRVGSACQIYDGIIYIFGGRNSNGLSSIESIHIGSGDDVYFYANTSTWNTLSSTLKAQRYGIGSTICKQLDTQYVYLIGGYDPDGCGYCVGDTIDIFDITSNQIISNHGISLNQQRYAPSVSCVNNHIYVLGGQWVNSNSNMETVGNWEISNALYTFSPTKSPTTIPTITPTKSPTLIPTITPTKPTINPTIVTITPTMPTSIPTTSTYAPTTMPTVTPVTQQPTTIEPTSSEPTTSIPTKTMQPTNQPSTLSPTVFIETLDDGGSGEIDADTTVPGNELNDERNKSVNNMNSVIFFIIGAVICFICILCIGLLFKVKKRKTDKHLPATIQTNDMKHNEVSSRSPTSQNTNDIFVNGFNSVVKNINKQFEQPKYFTNGLGNCENDETNNITADGNTQTYDINLNENQFGEGGNDEEDDEIIEMVNMVTKGGENDINGMNNNAMSPLSVMSMSEQSDNNVINDNFMLSNTKGNPNIYDDEFIIQDDDEQHHVTTKGNEYENHDIDI